MGQYSLQESIDIDAPADVAYNIIADYKDDEKGHKWILPPQYFSNLVVKKGGIGAGTEFDFTVTMAGQTQVVGSVVSEPEPGRVLVETNSNDVVTKFIVEPTGNGKGCKVTFDTLGNTAAGLQGWIEAKLAPMLLRRVYAEELGRLKQLAESLA